MLPVVIAGLGNPGREYEASRHNVGFLVVDRVAAALGATLRRRSGKYMIGQARLASAEAYVLLLKPLTYMNSSGEAVAEVLIAEHATPEQLLVILDDLALPLGTVRLRPGGSDGGHNGLASVILSLGTEEFPRLRCGIGREIPPPPELRSAFVLSPFDAEEREVVQTMIVRAAEAAQDFARTGILAAMNKHNL